MAYIHLAPTALWCKLVDTLRVWGSPCLLYTLQYLPHTTFHIWNITVNCLGETRVFLCVIECSPWYCSTCQCANKVEILAHAEIQSIILYLITIQFAHCTYLTMNAAAFGFTVWVIEEMDPCFWWHNSSILSCWPIELLVNKSTKQTHFWKVSEVQHVLKGSKTKAIHNLIFHQSNSKNFTDFKVFWKHMFIFLLLTSVTTVKRNPDLLGTICLTLWCLFFYVGTI